MTVHVELDLSGSLAIEVEQLGREQLVELLERGLKALRTERALEQYAAEKISFGEAARVAGLTHAELARQAYARGIEPRSSPEMLLEELG